MGGTRTDASASAVHGRDPQLLFEKILRARIYDTRYWKERCFGLNEETLLDEAVAAVREYGGTASGNNAKVTPFLCLCLKMLQIQPQKDVVLELLRNEDFKYVRLLAALYVRLTARPAEVFSYLEPLYNDYRRVRVRDAAGVHLARMDECVRELLTADTACSVALPRLPKRGVLEEGGQLTGPRRSALAEEFQAAKAKREAERKAEREREEAEVRREVEEERRRQREGGGQGERRRRDYGDGFGGYGGRKRDRDEEPEEGELGGGGGGSGGGAGGGGKEELDVDATNALRAKLGLAPLKS